VISGNRKTSAKNGLVKKRVVRAGEAKGVVKHKERGLMISKIIIKGKFASIQYLAIDAACDPWNLLGRVKFLAPKIPGQQSQSPGSRKLGYEKMTFTISI
jgi:hypothetical protein